MYTIGQVLFVVLSKKNQVYPMRVVETITKKTLQGEEISYVLQAGADKTTRITLDKVEGEIFDTSEKVRKILIHRATSQINKLVDLAVSKSNEWYGSTEQVQTIHDLPDLVTKTSSITSSTSPNLEEAIDDSNDVTTVIMPDGSIAKIKLPKITTD